LDAMPALRGESRQRRVVMRGMQAFADLCRLKRLTIYLCPNILKPVLSWGILPGFPCMTVPQYPILHEDERNGRDGRPLVIG
jgi:hypothetical protein